MVPLADLFNHKPAVVDLAVEYAVEGASDSDDDDSDDEQQPDRGGPQQQWRGDHTDNQALDNQPSSSTAAAVLVTRATDSKHEGFHSSCQQPGSRTASQQQSMAVPGGDQVGTGNGEPCTGMRLWRPIMATRLGGEQREELRLDIGICGLEQNGEEVLEVCDRFRKSWCCVHIS